MTLYLEMLYKGKKVLRTKTELCYSNQQPMNFSTSHRIIQVNHNVLSNLISFFLQVCILQEVRLLFYRVYILSQCIQRVRKNIPQRPREN